MIQQVVMRFKVHRTEANVRGTKVGLMSVHCTVCPWDIIWTDVSGTQAGHMSLGHKVILILILKLIVLHIVPM